MRLKSVLGEADKEKKFEKAREELLEIEDSSQWIVKEPVLFRGRSVKKDDQKYLKAKKTKKRRGTKDTHEGVDEVVHGFYESCYKDYPQRRYSRFATTDFGIASNYGNQVFVIIPHRDARISALYLDSFNLFMTVEQELRSLAKRQRNNHEHFETLSSNVQKILKVTQNVFKKNQNWKEVQKLPCPPEIYSLIKDDMDRHVKNDIPNSLHDPLKTAYLNILQYFKKTERGYPKKDGEAEDVMFEGKYIEVHKTLFEEVIGF